MKYRNIKFACVAAFIAAISLAGCADNISDAGTRFDGTYVGLQQGWDFSCTKLAPTKRVVANGVLTMLTPANQEFVGIVHPDGRITGGGSQITVAGRIDGGVLKMTEYTLRCYYEETSVLTKPGG